MLKDRLLPLFFDPDEGAGLGHLSDGKSGHVELVEVHIRHQFKLRHVLEELAKMVG